MGKYYWIGQIKKAGSKALKTAARTAVVIISTSGLMSDISWIEVISASALSGILAILTFVADFPEHGRNTSDTQKVYDDSGLLLL